jgi:branched-chain amino acid transport system ATP-binding protein
MAEPRLLLVDELSLGLMPKMVDLCLDVLVGRFIQIEG